MNNATSNFRITPNMLNGTDFNNSIQTRFEQYVEKNPEEISHLLTGIFGPGIKYDNSRKIKITDVTLREGDQAPLTSFNKEEKKFVYLMLRELAIHTIEVGFPAGETDFENIKDLVDFFGDDPNPPCISVLGRAVDGDNNASLRVLENCSNIRIHTFIATSRAHIWDKFCNEKGRTLEEGKEFVKNSIIKQISFLKIEQERRKLEGKTMEIEFSPEDATNTKYDFLLECIRLAIISGANIINVPDTLGISTPDSYKTLFFLLTQDTEDLKNRGYNFEFSTHVHNDKGMAMATALSGVKGGATQAETTMLGIGERTGNTSTSQTILNLGIDGKSNGGFEIDGINARFVAIFSQAIREILGDDPYSREPGIGTNAQTDGSGVHGANPNVYGGSKPYARELGVLSSEKYFSPRGGKNSIKELISMLGFSENELAEKLVKELVNIQAKKAEISRKQYASQIYRDYLEGSGELSDFSYEINNSQIAISFVLNGETIKITENIFGENGYIDALIKGLKKYLKIPSDKIELVNYGTREIPSLAIVIENVEKNIQKLIDTGYDAPSEYFREKIIKILESLPKEETSESVGLVHFEFNIDGKERNSLTFGKNVEEATIRAIFDAFLPEIVKVKRK